MRRFISSISSYVKIVVLSYLIISLFSACNNIKQIEDTIEVGEELNINKIFYCKDEGRTSIKIKDPTSINTSKVGTYNIILVITKGNHISEKEFTINVVDTQPPQIDAKNLIVYTGTYFDPELDMDITVTDNSSEDIQPKIISNNIEINNPGNYTIIFEATDGSGNRAQKEISVLVKDFENSEQLLEYAKRIITNGNYENIDCWLATGDQLIINSSDFFALFSDNISITYDASIISSVAPIEYANILYGGNVLTKENFFIRINATVEKTNVLINSSNWYTEKRVTISSDNGVCESENSVISDHNRSKNLGTIFSPRYNMTSKLGFNIYDIHKFNKVIEGNNISIKFYLQEGLRNENGKKVTLEIIFSENEAKKLRELAKFSKQFIHEYQ